MTDGEEERVGTRFDPTAVLPLQVSPDQSGLAPPERDLRIAVLESAIHCFQKNLLAKKQRDQQLFREAEQWIMDTDTCQPFSFERVCEALGLDPEYVRHGIQRWRQRQLEHPSERRIPTAQPSRSRTRPVRRKRAA